MNLMTRAELLSLQARPDADPVVIHVLPREDYEEAHIPGAINLPVDHEAFDRQVEQLTEGDLKRPVVVYCADRQCQASEQAAERLEQAGFRNVADYAGGLEDWKSAGLELASGPMLF